MDIVYTQPAEGGLLYVVLNQPRKKNAISAPMMDLVADAVRGAEADDSVRVIIIRGEGEVFSSGGDLSQTDPAEVTIEGTRATLLHYLRAIQAIRQVSKPVIAMVDGFAVGGAFSLMLACDLVCVSDRVKIVPAFCAIGIAPEMGIAKFLPDLVGDKIAKEILFTNRTLGAADLERWGLVNRVFPAADLEAGTAELARSISALPATSIQVTKALINSASDSNLNAVLEAEATASPFCAQSGEAKAAIARFAR